MTDQITRSSTPRKILPAGQPEGAVLLLAMLFLGGCGGAEVLKRVPVSGYISIDGAPLKAGSIRFVPIENTKGPAAVATIEDGIYELLPENGPIIGKHRIEIEAINHQGFNLDDEQSFAKQAEQGKPVDQNPVPESFNRKTGLFIDLPEEGKSDLDFRLTSSGVLADSR